MPPVRRRSLDLPHAQGDFPPRASQNRDRVDRTRSFHRDRSRAILREHPEIRDLVGPYWPSAACIIFVAILHVAIAAIVSQFQWWVVLAAAYLVGAVLALALWTLLHETTHDLVFRGRSANQWLGIAAGLPLIIPAAASFRKFHLLHHRHQGDEVLDGEIPSAWEVQLVGTNPLKKAIWMLAYPLLIAMRPARMRTVDMFDRWFVSNVVVQICFNVALVAMFGWGALAYCLLANIFALGLHPLGGRWIQEHYRFDPKQVTYSYYGSMNWLVFNAGYHVEHHDLVRIAWRHLPKVRRLADEHYKGLTSYTSWRKLLFNFFRAQELGLVATRNVDDEESPYTGAGEIQRDRVTPGLEA